MSTVSFVNLFVASYLMANFTPPCLVSNPKSQDWNYFSRQFQNYLQIIRAESDQALPLLLNCLGRDGLDIYDGLAEPTTTFEHVFARFEQHFGCRTSILLKRKAFFEARQTSTESATNFACRRRRLAKECNFGANQEELLRNIFVCGVHNDRLEERLLADESKLNFNIALAKAEAFERSQEERRKVTPLVSQCVVILPVNRRNLLPNAITVVQLHISQTRQIVQQ